MSSKKKKNTGDRGSASDISFSKKLIRFISENIWLAGLLCAAIIVALLLIFVPMCDGEAPSGYKEVELPDIAQFELPEQGEQVVVLETSMGEIYIRLFPEAAPKACADFLNIVNSGYADGINFHTLQQDTLIWFGELSGSDAAAKAAWNVPYTDEAENGLYNFYGSLVIADCSGSGVNSMQYYIVVKNDIDGIAIDDIKEYYGTDEFSAAIYEQVGGCYWLDYNAGELSNTSCTVLGQVYSGMETVYNISKAETNDKSIPLEPITVVRAYVVSYEG